MGLAGWFAERSAVSVAVSVTFSGHNDPPTAGSLTDGPDRAKMFRAAFTSRSSTEPTAVTAVDPDAKTLGHPDTATRALL